jgi:hypothetical protein
MKKGDCSIPFFLVWFLRVSESENERSVSAGELAQVERLTLVTSSPLRPTSVMLCFLGAGFWCWCLIWSPSLLPVDAGKLQEALPTSGWSGIALLTDAVDCDATWRVPRLRLLVWLCLSSWAVWITCWCEGRAGSETLFGSVSFSVGITLRFGRIIPWSNPSFF